MVQVHLLQGFERHCLESQCTAGVLLLLGDFSHQPWGLLGIRGYNLRLNISSPSSRNLVF